MCFCFFLASEATKELANHVFFFFQNSLVSFSQVKHQIFSQFWQALHFRFHSGKMASFMSPKIGSKCEVFLYHTRLEDHQSEKTSPWPEEDGQKNHRITEAFERLGGSLLRMTSRTPGTRNLFLSRFFFCSIFEDAMLGWVWVILLKWTHWSAHGTFWELRSNAWNSDCEAPKVLRWFLSTEVVEHIWWPKKAQCTSTVSHFGVKSLGLPKASPMSGATVNDHEAASFCRFWILQNRFRH